MADFVQCASEVKLPLCIHIPIQPSLVSFYLTAENVIYVDSIQVNEVTIPLNSQVWCCGI